MAIRDLTGQQFGRWTVIEKVSAPGAARWRCKCCCGTEREVAARHLVAGASTSCGCWTKEQVSRAAQIDLAGLRFGKLLVLESAGKSDGGERQWKCRCDCGKICVVLHRSLRSGKRTSCGCDSRRGRQTAKDVAGQKFAMLTALYPTQLRGHNGSVIWHCRCDCGNETDIALDKLKYSSVISCGCMREKCDNDISNRLTHVAGTSIDALKSSKLRSDNHTGVRGVYLKRGKYAVSITFQQKMFYLGSYVELEKAMQVRKEAEEILHTATVDFYEKWKKKADADPGWAEQNPISIEVEHRDGVEFSVELLPKLD